MDTGETVKNYDHECATKILHHAREDGRKFYNE